MNTCTYREGLARPASSYQSWNREHHPVVIMRNPAVLLLLFAMCAVTLSTVVRERRSYSDQDIDKAQLQALLQAIDEGKVDVNELFDKREGNPNRRLWFPVRVRLDWNTGKK